MSIEEVVLMRQIDFNNKWPTLQEVNTEALNSLFQRLKDNELDQIIVPVCIDKKFAFSTLSKDKELAKIFSSYLDLLHLLPFHPDLAFDTIWRSLEYTIKVYAKRAWGYGADKGIAESFKKVSEEIISPKATKEISLMNAFDNMFENMSVSLSNYVAARLLYSKTLSVAPQIELVKERARGILPAGFIEEIHNAYDKEDGSMDTKGIRDTGRRISRLIKGKDYEVGGNNHQPLSFAERVHFLLSIVLYTSRCERFHGDVYSPFKSSKSTLNRYYDYYYLTLSSALIFWVVIEKLVEREDATCQFVDFAEVQKSIEESVRRMKLVLTNK